MDDESDAYMLIAIILRFIALEIIKYKEVIFKSNFALYRQLPINKN